MTAVSTNLAYFCENPLSNLPKAEQEVINKCMGLRRAIPNPLLHTCGSHHYYIPNGHSRATTKPTDTTSHVMPASKPVYIIRNFSVSGLSCPIIRVPQVFAEALSKFLPDSPLPKFCETVSIPLYAHGLILGVWASMDTMQKIYNGILKSIQLQRQPNEGLYNEIAAYAQKHKNMDTAPTPRVTHLLYALSSLMMRKVDAAFILDPPQSTTFPKKLVEAYALLKELLPHIRENINSLHDCLKQFQNIKTALSTKKNETIYRIHIKNNEMALCYAELQIKYLSSFMDVLQVLQNEPIENGLSLFCLDLSTLCNTADVGGMQCFFSTLPWILEAYIEMIPDIKKPYYENFYKELTQSTIHTAPQTAVSKKKSRRSSQHDTQNKVTTDYHACFLRSLLIAACVNARLDEFATELWNCPIITVEWLDERHAEIISLLLFNTISCQSISAEIDRLLIQNKNSFLHNHIFTVHSLIKAIGFQLQFLEGLPLSADHPFQPLIDNLYRGLQNEFTFQIFHTTYSVAQIRHELHKLEQQEAYASKIPFSSASLKDLSLLIVSWAPLFTFFPWYSALYSKEVWLEMVQQCSPEQAQELFDQRDHALLQTVQNIHDVVSILSSLTGICFDVDNFSNIFTMLVHTSRNAEEALPTSSIPEELDIEPEQAADLVASFIPNETQRPIQTSPPSVSPAKNGRRNLKQGGESSHSVSYLEETPKSRIPPTWKEVETTIRSLTTRKSAVETSALNKTFSDLHATIGDRSRHTEISIPIQPKPEFNGKTTLKLMLPMHSAHTSSATINSALKNGITGLFKPQIPSKKMK